MKCYVDYIVENMRALTENTAQTELLEMVTSPISVLGIVLSKAMEKECGDVILEDIEDVITAIIEFSLDNFSGPKDSKRRLENAMQALIGVVRCSADTELE
jgi:hypothetical protein